MVSVAEQEMKNIVMNRINVLTKAKKNKELCAVEMALCRKDILYFFKNYVYTDKNTNLYSNELPSVLPFIPYPFQEEAVEEIRSSIITGTQPISERTEFTNVFIEKSRQMGLSWLIMIIFVYGFIFFNHKYHVISQKESDVDKPGDMRSLFEKARFVITNLPSWMKPSGYVDKIGSAYNKYMSISKEGSTGSITGESANPNASRSGTYNAVLMDEMAFMQHATRINTAAASATPTRIFNSTPNGEGNEFYRMRKLTQTIKKEGEEFPPSVKGLRYHWSDHPLYDKERYDWKTQGRSQEKIAQELEIDYNVAVKGRVYPEFKGETREVEYNPNLPVYVWIDNGHGGSDPHAIIVAQTEHDTHFINILDCMQMNCSIPDMANYLNGTPKINLNDYEFNFLERYKNYNTKMGTFISDPYDTKSMVKDINNVAGTVIFDEYRKVGINLVIPQKTDIKVRIMNTKSNIYRLRVHERCQEFLSAIQNARYPESPEGSTRTTASDKPIHDRTSHMRTALEYGMAYLLENEFVVKKARVVKDTRPMRDYRTGKLIEKK